MHKRKTIPDVNREVPICSDSVYQPPPKPVKSHMSEIPRSLSDFDRKINTDFEENSPFQEGVI